MCLLNHLDINKLPYIHTPESVEICVGHNTYDKKMVISTY